MVMSIHQADIVSCLGVFRILRKARRAPQLWWQDGAAPSDGGGCQEVFDWAQAREHSSISSMRTGAGASSPAVRRKVSTSLCKCLMGFASPRGAKLPVGNVVGMQHRCSGTRSLKRGRSLVFEPMGLSWRAYAADAAKPQPQQLGELIVTASCIRVSHS